MKQAIVLLAIIIAVLSSCDYVERVEDILDGNTEESYVSSNGAITISIKYNNFDDLDAKYERYGDLIDTFADDVEARILED